MTCGAIGVLSKMAAQGGASPRTFDVDSERCVFVSESIKPRHIFTGQERGAGELAPTAGARRLLFTTYEGTIVLAGSYDNLQTWIKRAAWTGESASPYSTGQVASDHEFDLLIERENGVFRYSDCLVNALSFFSDSKNQITYLAIGIVAKTSSQATAWPSPEPEESTADSSYPFTHYELTLDVNSVDLPVSYVALTINNWLYPVGNTSVTPQKFKSAKRDITLSCTAPFLSGTLAQSDSLMSTTADATLTLDSTLVGNAVFDLQNFQNIGHTHPSAESPDYMLLNLHLIAGKDDTSTAEFTATFN